MILFMRLDKYLCGLNLGTRAEIKGRIRKGAVQVNGVTVTNGDVHIDEKRDLVVFEGRKCSYAPYVYYIMNKPSGVVSATRDEHDRTVMDVFFNEYAGRNQGSLEGIPAKDMFPVGRLDKDTVGLLLLTNDGDLAHRLLSPKKHIPKTYYVKTYGIIPEDAVISFQEGIFIGKEEQCRPAKLELAGSNEAFLTIWEGKFHQVKRMFHKIGLEVIYLKRISMGNLKLPDDLPEGKIRELTMDEVEKLC